MATERLYQFPSKLSPVPADILFCGDSANSFNEVQITIAELIAAYPNLSSIAALTLNANTFPFVNNSAVFTAGTITALAVSLLADSTVAQMQVTLSDTNGNFSANNFLSGYATTVTAAGTTVLTAASKYAQFFTGATTQIVTLPVTSTLVLGFPFYIFNNSSGNVTVNSSGGNAVQVMAPGTSLYLTCILTSGTTAASWNGEYAFNGGEGSGTVNSGTINQLSWYAATGVAVSGLATANNGVLVTSAGGVPSISSTLPSALNVPQPNIVGVTTNSNAAAGSVGEMLSSVIASPGNSISSATLTDLTSLVLTPGDWDVWGNIFFIPSVSTTAIVAFINTTSVTAPDSSLRAALQGAFNGVGILAPSYRITVATATTTTIYLTGFATLSSGTATFCGGLYARRRR
jgi:hypothetical protein